jgi:hypothetical protein
VARYVRHSFAFQLPGFGKVYLVKQLRRQIEAAHTAQRHSIFMDYYDDRDLAMTQLDADQPILLQLF